MNNISSAIENDISKILLDLSERKVDIINPNYIAAEVERNYGNVDSKHQYLAVMKLRDMVRAYLARKLDPVVKVDDDSQASFFDGALQDHYPAKRQDERVYIKRDLLTDSDIADVISRMQKKSDGLLAHIDALIAWNKSREAA